MTLYDFIFFIFLFHICKKNIVTSWTSSFNLTHCSFSFIYKINFNAKKKFNAESKICV